MRQRVIGKSLFSQVVDSDQYSGIYSPDTQYYFKSKKTWPSGPITGLYAFTSFTFTAANTTGVQGPTLNTLKTSYNTSTYPWLNNTSYFNVDSTVQGMQLWTVPKTANYRITAKGANGGSVGATAYTGGIGAEISGIFSLTSGDILEIIVGQDGSDHADGAGGASGGGGSFVVARNGNTISDIYVIAGGGGGAEFDSGRNSSDHGGSGQSDIVTGGAGQNSSETSGSYGAAAPNFTTGSYGDIARGGINGYGGGGAVGGGGGGFFDRGGTGNTGTTLMTTTTQCGYGYLTGTGYTAAYRAQGGYSNQTNETGGFGGGGGAQVNTGYGGGGGGYSGGGAGNFSGSLQGNGGGGGSINNGTVKTRTVYNQVSHPGSLAGHSAFVKIELV